MTPAQEYLQRASQIGVLRLTPRHHHIMDRIFYEFRDDFVVEDVYQRALADPIIVNADAIAGNTHRIKLFVIRAIEGLFAVGMVRKLESAKKRYRCCWTPPV